MDFDNIPHSQRLLAALEKLETRGPTLSSTEGADVSGAMQALKTENNMLKERQQKIVQRVDRLIKTLEKASS